APGLRRLPLDASLAPTAAEWITVADLSNYGTGSYAYGLDYTGAILDIAAGDWNLLLGNEVQVDGTLLPTLFLTQPTLPPPDDVLDLLSGSTVLSSQVFFSHSCCTDHSGVLRYDVFGAPGAQWSVFLTKDKMGNPDAFAAWATEVPEPTVYVVGDTAIYKVLPDGTIVNQQEIPLFTSFEPVQMRTDSAGRLYFAYSDVLSVFDTAGSNGFTELAHRTLLSATRFDLLEEDPSTVHVFYGQVDGEAMLGEQLFYW
ncbi:MAG: hypothetical protein IT373_06795, partial [Polyangiaceae bacterium]|nr:hypothetical protein [Polyangiaceae bacterium]